MYKDTIQIFFKLILAIIILGASGYGLVQLITFVSKKIEEQKNKQ